MSMYKFIVGEDGESIVYFAKYFGVYPKMVPRNTFSDLPADGNIKFTVQFKASFVEDMDPNIIEDFNEISNLITKGNPRLGGYLPEFGGWSGEYMHRPYIVKPSNQQTDMNLNMNKNQNNSAFYKDGGTTALAGYSTILPNRGFYKLKWEG